MKRKSKILVSEKKERIGWYFYDWANSAFPTTVITVFLGPYITTIAKNAAGDSGILNIFGINIAAGSYFPYLVSLSVLIQLLILPFIGALADYTNKKKQFLAFFAYMGALATAAMYFLEGTGFIYGGILFLIGNTGFGASIVMYNAFLTDLAEPENRDSVSSTGWAFGYIGGGTLLALNLVLFSSAESFGISTGDAVRISLSSAGVWWGIFSIFPLLMLKNRKEKKPPKLKGKSLLSQSLRQLANTFKNAKQYPKTLYFLAAYLFFNDGVQSVIALSAQFGQEELGLEMSVLTTVILIVQFVAFGGALLFGYLASKFGSKEALIISLIIWSLAVCYSFFFLYDAAGFYLLGIVIGLVLGGTQALSRSIFSKVIPLNQEAEYFSLYEISERGTSWIGPFVFGITYQFTSSYRLAILSLIAFFIIGLVMLVPFNLSRAMNDIKKNEVLN